MKRILIVISMVCLATALATQAAALPIYQIQTRTFSNYDLVADSWGTPHFIGDNTWERTRVSSYDWDLSAWMTTTYPPPGTGSWIPDGTWHVIDLWEPSRSIDWIYRGYGPSGQAPTSWYVWGMQDNIESVVLGQKSFYTPGPIPEPATLFMIGIGLIGLAGAGRRMRRHPSDSRATSRRP